MMRLVQIILLFSAVLLASCGGDRRVDDILSAADSLVFVAPDSAVRLLDSLPLGHASADQLDLYALLSVKAREKVGTPVSDDTADSLLSRSIAALSRAADHYRGRGDSLEVQTLFYRGVLLGYRGDYSEALVSLMEAADRAADTGDNFYRAMAYREQATVYVNLYSYEQAARLGQKAADAFILADRPIYAAWERVYLPLYLAYSGHVDEAYEMIDELKNDSLIMSEPPLRRQLYDIAINVSLNCNDIVSAERYLDAYSAEGGLPASRQLSGMVSLKIRQGDTAGALRYYDLAMAARHNAVDSAAADWALVHIYEARGDYKSAHDLQSSLNNTIYKKTNHLVTHPYTTLVTGYYHEAMKGKQLQLAKLKNEKMQLLLLFASIFVVAISVVVSYRQRIRRKNVENELLLDEIEKLRLVIRDEQKKNNSRDKDSFAIGMLNEIVESANCLLLVNGGETRLGRNIADIITALRNDSRLSELETFVNEHKSGLMERFRSHVSGITEKESKVAILVFLGFSDTSIATILDYKTSASVRQVRCRIRKRINASDTDESRRFLTYFDAGTTTF